jgi:hypothetical protein
MVRARLGEDEEAVRGLEQAVDLADLELSHPLAPARRAALLLRQEAERTIAVLSGAPPPRALPGHP